MRIGVVLRMLACGIHAVELDVDRMHLLHIAERVDDHEVDGRVLRDIRYLNGHVSVKADFMDGFVNSVALWCDRLLHPVVHVRDELVRPVDRREGSLSVLVRREGPALAGTGLVAEDGVLCPSEREVLRVDWRDGGVGGCLLEDECVEVSNGLEVELEPVAIHRVTADARDAGSLVCDDGASPVAHLVHTRRDAAVAVEVSEKELGVHSLRDEIGVLIVLGGAEPLISTAVTLYAPSAEVRPVEVDILAGPVGVEELVHHLYRLQPQ